MKANVIVQRDFSAGQIDDTAMRADDTPVMRAGLKRARNVRILASRSVRRRPGRRLVFQTTGIAEIVRPVVGVEFFMAIEPGQMRFRSIASGTTQTFAGMPWTADIIDDVRWIEEGGVVIVAHQSFQPRVFTYNRFAGTWVSTLFDFAQDPTLAIRAPFYNFALGSGVQLQPTARFGSIVLSASAGGVFQPGHVGTRFRYADRQIIIDSIGPNGASAAGTVVELLPPTFLVGVNNTVGLQPGDVVEGVQSGAKGQVISVSPLAFVVLLTKTWSGFAGTEIIAGPRSRMTFSGTQTELPPAATSVWDEQLMSPVRGWPGVVSKAQRRVVFSRFPQAGSGVIWSSIGTLNDFRIGAERDDAIFEFVPENCAIQDVVDGSDIFVFTDKGTFYVPVSEASPLIPGSVSFREISDDPAAGIRPRKTSEGLVFVNATKTRVLAIIGTGQTAKPYLVEDITEYHQSLLRSPVAMASTSSDVSAPERYVYVANEDGTLAVGRYQRERGGRGWVGWVPWDGRGKIKWVASDGPYVVVTAEYTINGVPVRYVEQFDDDLLLDATQPIATAVGGSPLLLASGLPLLLISGQPLLLSDRFAFNWAPGTTISVEQNGWYRGDYTIEVNGSLSNQIPILNATALRGGFNFEVEVTPFIAHDPEGQSVKQRLRPRRIKQCAATVLRSQAVEVAGRLIPFYRAGENEEQAPAARTETHRARVLGREFDPEWSVRQTLPGQLTIVELTTDITV